MVDMGKTILLVDDEELNTDMLSRRLIRSGFLVHIARNGVEALTIIQTRPVDLVLLDQMMPGMSGREVLEKIRNDFGYDSLPVIMVTAIAESDRIAEALEAGANDYVTKPIDYRVTLARINSQLARRNAEAALRTSEERYALAAKASRDAIWDWDLKSGTVYYSERWIEMLGLTAGQLNNTPECWFSRVFTSDLPSLMQCIEDAKAGRQEIFDCNYRVHHASGSILWMSTRAVVSKGADGLPVRLSGSQSDVTTEKTQDPLTGLLNRVALKSGLEHLFLRSNDPEIVAVPYALLFLDLDGFKAINDSLGHLAGDHLLCTVADRIRTVSAEFLELRAAEGCLQITCARLGGDEFAILIESKVSQQHSDELALQLQNAMRAPVLLDGRSIHVALSLGVASSCNSHTAYEELLFDADLAMYAAKKSGRGSVAAFDPQMRKVTLDRLTLENELRIAIASNQMYLLYQPKVRLETGRIYGVEALIRWNHPTRGIVSPNEFIPIAEETGQVVELGHWVLRTACEQILEWHHAHPTEPQLELSVNLSPREFKHEGLIEQIVIVLEETGFPPASLHFEITEGVLFENLAEARVKLQALQSLGVLLDLDDFGSGYSSLRYLSELPFNTLKIDRYFVSSLDMDTSSSSAGLIETILAMANTLGLKVVAEGVETLPHALLLKEMGCEFAQGYYFSKPVLPAAIQQILLRAIQRSVEENAQSASPLNKPTTELLLGAGI